MGYQYTTMFLAGVNISILILQMLRYIKFAKSKIPGLNYGIAQFAVSVLYSFFMALCFLLPNGPLLEFFVTLALSSSLWVNTFFMLIVFVLTSKPDNRFARFRWVLILIPALFTLLFVTNGWHHLVLNSVTKPADGFAYELDLGVLAMPVFAYAFVISAVAVLKVLRSGWEGIIPSAKVRWLMLATTVMPFFFGLGEMTVPLLAKLHISLVLIWVPITLLSYLFFGYLSTARHMAISEMTDAYVVFDLKGYCVDINPKGEAFFERFAQTRKPAAAQLEAMMPQDVPMADCAECEIELTAENGRQKYYRISSFQLSNGLNQFCGNGYMIREVTDFRREIGQLNDIAAEDPLTGAKNRRFLESNAEAIIANAIEKEAMVAVLMLDIDYFKRINDTYGHLAGDEVLVEASAIFSQNVRGQDTVFRYGGEEFLVLCEGTALPVVRQLAERIRKAVDKNVFHTGAGPLKLTVSVGFYAAMPKQGDTLPAFVQKADEYLYEAKQKGRNRVEGPAK